MREKYRTIEGKYIDSVLLMQISREIEKIKGVSKATCMVATMENKSFMEIAGFHPPPVADSSSIIIGVVAESDEICDEAINSAMHLIDAGLTQQEKRFTIDDLPQLITPDDFPVVFISTPSEYVYDIANKSLDYGANVHIFSSNVPIEQELKLKEKGMRKGLFVMGPDCGTSIIGGKGLGFSNELGSSGDIGIIGSSGTGIQELSVLLDKNGLGVSYAIGVGSNDLRPPINGIMTKQALEFLKQRCSAIAVISKNPDKRLEMEILELMKDIPSTFISLGKIDHYIAGKTFVTGIIDDGVSYLISQIGKGNKLNQKSLPPRLNIPDSRKLLRGFFVGGSLCYQAQAILQEKKIPVYSNAPVDKKFEVYGNYDNLNVCIDTGAEEFVVGKPHPMIDPLSRNSILVHESRREDVRVILFDVILGYGSAEDPLAGLEDIETGAALVASICGTNKDKQGYDVVTRKLEKLGVTVLESAAKAAEYAASLMR
ncbi:MAG: hypothetical protein ACP5UZ_07325 [Thermoplasmata archaeon]